MNIDDLHTMPGITPEEFERVCEGILALGNIEPMNFRHRMYGDWLHEEEPSQAEQMAKVYHTECDAYDRQVCTGDRNGEPIPITPEEFRAINHHSREVRQRLLRENPGVTEKQLHEAIAKLAKYEL